ncbi:2'-deoxycytidine 5'-triphosphate deaminase [Candidatus Kaiserbacteria bacterium RIFCSPHIGHO2_01_FULL_48_10]|uniref:2'-deoxycytidine 5'-triphosphate deaminase n=1 Tax=Candidatus Kaiserbacteria bacterium RIFCSPHIGHO2_01_FULL_48_10 TaxID=1798476 RepID=A0A1F6C320_9BACT|nr:MAG: 2'-deoxycytidine 5'-triphosphate deaminase [Candidatus Kaiserbacteria bacterium RIFCSPHIGHO2_01_FULL_48_10]
MTLPFQGIKKLINDGLITKSGPFVDGQIQPASLDCTLGNRVFRVTSSFLPQPNEKIADIVKAKTLYEFELVEGSILEPNASYIIPLQEHIKMPAGFQAYSNPKSSIGRIDVFVRLLVDGNAQFDVIPEGYEGPLYLEVIPLTFVVAVSPGIALNQIRFRKTDTHFLGDADLRDLHKSQGLLFDLEGKKIKEPIIRDNSLFLTADLQNREVIGFRAKHNATDVLDLTKKDFYGVEQFWEPIKRPANGEFVLVPGDFYLLGSNERIAVPPDYSAEMASYDPQSGELRAHYAGFFDSGFGYEEGEGIGGTTAVLEVRAHNVPFRLTHGQIICRFIYERMMERPEKVYGKSIKSHYTGSAPKLPKFFKNVW